MKEIGDDWLAHDIYFIRDALFFCEFEQAVAYADPGRILRVLKYWCFAFRGASQHNYARECAEVLLKWKYELDDMLRKALERSWFVNRWAKEGRWIPADLYLEQLNFWVKVSNTVINNMKKLTISQQRVFIAQGNGVTVKYIIEKGSACVEAFREVTNRVSKFFGNSETPRRSKEISFLEDMRVLVEDMERRGIHRSPPKKRMVPAAKKQSGKKEAVSAVVDVQVVGAEIWENGKFSEFLKNTTYDPATGYAIPEGDNHDSRLDTGSVFDRTDDNPLEYESFNDLHGDDDDDTGLNALGGGSEFSTGEIILS